MTLPTNSSNATRSVHIEDWCVLVRKTDRDDWQQVCHSPDPSACQRVAELYLGIGYQVRVLPTK